MTVGRKIPFLIINRISEGLSNRSGGEFTNIMVIPLIYVCIKIYGIYCTVQLIRQHKQKQQKRIGIRFNYRLYKPNNPKLTRHQAHNNGGGGWEEVYGFAIWKLKSLFVTLQRTERRKRCRESLKRESRESGPCRSQQCRVIAFNFDLRAQSLF